MSETSSIVPPGTSSQASADQASETYETHGPRCPYCQHLHTPDDELYFDNMRTELECDQCGRIFDVDIYTETSWTCTPREATMTDRPKPLDLSRYEGHCSLGDDNCVCWSGSPGPACAYWEPTHPLLSETARLREQVETLKAALGTMLEYHRRVQDNLGEAVHTSLRKGVDSKGSSEAWAAISKMADGGWGEAVSFALFGLEYGLEERIEAAREALERADG